MQGTIAAVILAGGQGRRLGGVDKALLPVGQQPLLVHVLARLRPQCAKIVLSANGDHDRFRTFALPVVADAGPDQGPLAGIAAAAAAIAVRWPEVTHILTVPVDVPLLPLDLAVRLADVLKVCPHQAVIAEAGGRMHWTIALWPIAAAAALRTHVQQGGMRRLQDGLATVGWKTAAFPDAEAFANLNEWQDRDSISLLSREN